MTEPAPPIPPVAEPPCEYGARCTPDDPCGLHEAQAAPPEGAVAKPYIIVCANGADHRDYGVGEVSAAVSERAARDAADFMDDERDSSPWECGPHSVRRQSDPSAQFR